MFSKCMYQKGYGTEDGAIKVMILLNLRQILKMNNNSAYRVLLSSLASYLQV